jgi:Polyketide cyclase / dehydrase and lipid transport
MLKKILIGIAAIAVLLVAIAFALPRQFKVEREVAMNATPAVIYPLIATPKYWPEWGVWSKRDRTMVTTFSGAASGKGAKWAWKSKAEGDGEMEFIAEEPLKSLTYQLKFPDFSSAIMGTLIITPLGDNVSKVTWKSEGDLGNNPIARYFGLMMDKMLGADFVASLDGLKALAEKKALEKPAPAATPPAESKATEPTKT